MTLTLRQKLQRDEISINPRFQAACQRYAHEGGSSYAIAASVLSLVGDDFADALHDPEGLIAILDLARQLWEGEELASWMLTPQSRWEGRTPLQMCGQNLADDVLDVLEQMELK